MPEKTIKDLITEAQEHSQKAISLFAEAEELHKTSLLSTDTHTSFELTHKVILKTKEGLAEMRKVAEIQKELIELERKEIFVQGKLPEKK